MSPRPGCVYLQFHDHQYPNLLIVLKVLHSTFDLGLSPRTLDRSLTPSLYSLKVLKTTSVSDSEYFGLGSQIDEPESFFSRSGEGSIQTAVEPSTGDIATVNT